MQYYASDSRALWRERVFNDLLGGRRTAEHLLVADPGKRQRVGLVILGEHVGTTSVRIVYILLSSTFGMHQYTADLAYSAGQAGHEVHLVTTQCYVADRYNPNVQVHTPITTEGTGFNTNGVRSTQYRAASRAVRQLRPDVVHFTGVHLWNPGLLWQLRRSAISTVHTLHDLDPHPGVRFGPLIRSWNRCVIRYADHILVHGECYRKRLTAELRDAPAVTAIPLVHLFGSHASVRKLAQSPPEVSYENQALFFGRIEKYKGVPELLTAVQQSNAGGTGKRLILAGQGDIGEVWHGAVPDAVELHNHHIADDEAVELFRRCSVVVLPYTGATQSALIAAAYAFSKPVIVSDSGALAEYVIPQETGWVVPAGDTDALASALNEALSCPDRSAQLGRAGRHWYDQQATNATDKLGQLYAQVHARA